MIDLARRYLPVPGRVQYLLNQRDDLANLEAAGFDLIFSSITLQHVQPELASNYMREFVRLLRPGGLLVFQLPTHRVLTLQGAIGRLLPASLRRSRAAGIEMYGAPPECVVETLSSAGARVIDIRPDHSGGAAWPGLRYAATK
jgi:SAM-dependent methyltransferase